MGLENQSSEVLLPLSVRFGPLWACDAGGLASWEAVSPELTPASLALLSASTWEGPASPGVGGQEGA